MYQQAKASCAALVQKKDAIIAEAISDFLGTEQWTLTEIAYRAQIKKYPDGIEVFALDGNDLLMFYPMEMDVDHEGGGMKITSTVRYRRLDDQSGIKPNSPPAK